MTSEQRVKTLHQELTVSSEQVRFSDEEIDIFASTGQLAVREVFTPTAFDIVASSCHRLANRWRPLPYTRSLEDRTYHNVDRATLFRDPRGYIEAIHKTSLHAPELITLERWSDRVVAAIGGRLLDRGHDDPARLLRLFMSSRAVINRMNGTVDDPAVLGLHLDPPAEIGANASFSLGGGTNLSTGLPVEANVLSIYACKNLSEALGISQPLHGISSDAERMSLVYTQFITAL